MLVFPPVPSIPECASRMTQTECVCVVVVVVVVFSDTYECLIEDLNIHVISTPM